MKEWFVVLIGAGILGFYGLLIQLACRLENPAHVVIVVVFGICTAVFGIGALLRNDNG